MMQLTGHQLKRLAIELRATARALDEMAESTDDHSKPFNYPDHSLTVMLAKEFLVT